MTSVSMNPNLTPPTGLSGTGDVAAPDGSSIAAPTLTIAGKAGGIEQTGAARTLVPLSQPPQEPTTDALLAAMNNVGNLPETGGLADIFSVMILFHQMGVEMREANREMQLSALQVKIDKLGDVANKIREAATKAMWAGIAMGAAQIGAGALSFAGGAKSLKATKEPLKNLGKANEALKNAQSSMQKATNQLKAAKSIPGEAGSEVQQANKAIAAAQKNLTKAESAQKIASGHMQEAAQQGHAINTLYGGTGQGISGSGQITGAVLEKDAKMAEADRQHEQAGVEEAGHMYDSWGDAKRHQQEVNQGVRAALSSILTEHRQTVRNVWTSV